MAGFLFSAMPFRGHVTPMLAIAAALVRRGHEVRIYTGAAFRSSVEKTGARWVPWTRAADFDENDVAATFPRLVGAKGMRQLMINMADLFIGTAPGQVADLEEEWDREPADALVADEAALAPGLFAEKHGCRWATVAVLPLNLPSAQGPPSGMGLRLGKNAVMRGRDAVLRALAPTFAGFLRAPTAAARAQVGLPPPRVPYNEFVFSRRLILASGVPALDHSRTDRPPRLRWVGSLRGGDPQHPRPSWWDQLRGRRVVLVTQGTYNVDPDELIRPAVTALADIDAAVVVTTGVAGRHTLPFPVPANAHVEDFVPYDEVLERADLVITNGGWGGTLAALSHGVPLIVAGGDLDKPEVAGRVESAGAGVNLHTGRPRARAVRAAFDRIDADTSYRDAAARVAADLRGAGGADRAADLLVEYARSPADA